MQKDNIAIQCVSILLKSEQILRTEIHQKRLDL